MMPFCHQAAKDSSLSFTDSYLAIEIVRIHQCQVVQDIPDGEIIQGMFGELPLGKKLSHGFKSLVEGVLA